MKKKKYYIFSLDMTFLNIFSFVILGLVIGITYIIDKNFLIDSIVWTFAPNRLFLTFVLIILYLMLHEVFHSIGYYIYGAKYKNIVYGIELEKDIEFSEFDDTTSFGLYSDKDLSKGKYLGIKYITNVDKLERKDYKKIKVSKMSYIIIFVILGISFITLFM